jgi:hypothetical protein
LNKSKTISLFLSFILIAGTIAAFLPSSSFTKEVHALSDYKPMKNDYNSKYLQYNKENIDCTNLNLNANGLNVNGIPESLSGLLPDQAQAGDSDIGISAYGTEENRFGSYDEDFVYKCINNNYNDFTGTTTPLTPTPTPTASLTVVKEIYGCDNIIPTTPFLFMDCQFLLDNDDRWIQCDDPRISGSSFCRALQENLFDIEVLDNQNNPLREFVGSPRGTTIENLEPGTYTVEEIKYPTPADNQLGENSVAASICINGNEFTDGGDLQNEEERIGYTICIEYEDEQGNDCSTITLAAEESRTCTVKNYIRNAVDSDPEV